MTDGSFDDFLAVSEYVNAETAKLTPGQKTLVKEDPEEFVTDLARELLGVDPTPERTAKGALRFKRSRQYDILGGAPNSDELTAEYHKNARGLQENQIQAWAHMLDESMNEKGINENWTTDGSDFVQTARELGFDGRQTSMIASAATGIIEDAIRANSGSFDGEVTAEGDVGEFKIYGIEVEGDPREDEYRYAGINGEERSDTETTWEVTNVDYPEQSVLGALDGICGMTAQMQSPYDVAVDWNRNGTGYIELCGKLLVKDRSKFEEWVREDIV